MTQKPFEVVRRLQGKTLVTAESLTGGMIGSILTSVPGASKVFKGGIISYTDDVKREVLGVPAEILEKQGAVSAPVALAMASGARKRLKTDYAVSVTGLAGPDGDEFGHEVGTVFIGFECQSTALVKEFRFYGDREAVRRQTVKAALQMILDHV